MSPRTIAPALGLALALGVVAGCAPEEAAAPHPPLEDLGPARGEAPDQLEILLDVGGGGPLALACTSVGRGGYSVPDPPPSGFAAEWGVLTPTRSSAADVLAFTYRAPDGGWRVALAERDGGGDAYALVGTSEHVAASWADWAVASLDGRLVAAWVEDGEREGKLHLMERDGDRLALVARRFPEAVKAFPSFAPNGRLAARLPVLNDKGKLYYCNAIGEARGELLARCGEVVFDATGEHFAYAGLRREDNWYVLHDGGAAGPFAAVDGVARDAEGRLVATVRREEGDPPRTFRVAR